jgi:hypothetical protein
MILTPMSGLFIGIFGGLCAGVPLGFFTLILYLSKAGRLRQ